MDPTTPQPVERQAELRVALAVFGFLVVCTLIQFTPDWWSPALREWFGEGMAVLAFRWMAAGVAVIALVRQWRGPLRAAMAFLTTAMVMGALASLLYHLGNGSDWLAALAWMQPQRLVWLVAYVALAATILALPAKPDTARDPALVVLDVALAGGVGTLLVWFYFIHPGGDDSLRFFGDRNFIRLLAQIGYPALDVVLLIVLLVRPALRRTGGLRGIFLPVTVGVGLVLVGDTLKFLQAYGTSTLLEMLTALTHRAAPVAFLLASLRAWRPLSDWSPAQPVAVGRRLGVLSSAAVVLVLLALFLEELDHGHPHLVILSVGAVLAGLLLLMRQAVLQRRRDALVASQRQELELRVAERTAELAAAKSRLELLASEDPLTGLPNRRAFDDALATAWSSCARARQPLSIALLDIDYFKAYNDHFGHAAGDSCLQNVARVLQRVVRRRTDLVARYGGEEFLLLMPQTDAEGAMVFAERVREAIEGAALTQAPQVATGVVTVSIGVVTIDPDPVSMPESLFFAADAALYEAKAEGRNRVSAGRV